MNRIWVDGCFDFFHHGHAGALNQARALGDALVVGIHTDEEILKNKGPVVMHLDERACAVRACRWTSEVVCDAPYVTEFRVMDAHHCEYVAHGDDITTDANGNDCYQAAKDAGRFLEFKRTPNISTTDLIGRMLARTTAHHMDAGSPFLQSEDAQQRFAMYARGEDARSPYAGVFNYTANGIVQFVAPQWRAEVVYTEGTFDLFHPGHMEFLAGVAARARELGAKVVVGLRSDAAANAVRGEGHPTMNIFERALCLLQCRFVDAVVLNVPFATDSAARVHEIERALNTKVVAVARGSRAPAPGDNLAAGLVVPPGKYAALSASQIVERVLSNRAQYEERQRKKGVKAVHEETMR